MTPRLGIDLGGTKIEGILLEANEIVDVFRTATPKDDYPATINAIIDVISELESRHTIDQPLPVGIGTPGAISHRTGLMKNCNSTCLNGQNLLADLARQSGRSVRIANDADCFALSEASDGAGKNGRSVFGVILGTGVGGGLCYQGKLLEGANAICGEWGHNPIALNALTTVPNQTLLPGRACYCGRYDCVEAWLSGPAFEARYLERTQQHRSARDITSCLQTDQVAADLMEQYCHLLALALSNVINIFDPDIIVLGGGMSNIPQLYDRVPEILPTYVFSDQINTIISQARHGDSSGVRGAAWLWPEAD
ncbi:MAG: ROK family protein [Pseudomonadota bacterium]